MNLQSPKFVLITIALLFFTPLLLAVLMRSGWWDFKPSSFSNRGTLVQPPVALPMAKLDLQYARSGKLRGNRDQWVLLYPFPVTCDSACQRAVTGLRQIHKAAGRDRPRVALWLLTPQQTSLETQNMLVGIYPGFDILIDSSGEAGLTLAALEDDTGTRDRLLQRGQAFLLDPATNIILRYTPDFDPNDINKDLDRLLTWSATD